VRVTVGPALRGWPRPLQEGSAASRVTRGSGATCVLPALRARPPISSPRSYTPYPFLSFFPFCPSLVGDPSNRVCYPSSFGLPRPPLDLSKFWNGCNEETFFFFFFFFFYPETLVKGIEWQPLEPFGARVWNSRLLNWHQESLLKKISASGFIGSLLQDVCNHSSTCCTLFFFLITRDRRKKQYHFISFLMLSWIYV
jgi:hypothetical protein